MTNTTLVSLKWPTHGISKHDKWEAVEYSIPSIHNSEEYTLLVLQQKIVREYKLMLFFLIQIISLNIIWFPSFSAFMAVKIYKYT